MTVLSAHTLSSTAGVFPAPYKSLLTASLDSSLILWDPRSPTPIWKASIFAPPNAPELDPAEHGITALAVSPNGQIAAVGGAAGGVKLVNLAKGNVLSTLTGHATGESVEALVFVDLLAGAGGGKGVVCVSGGTDGKGFVWDSATGRVRAELQHDVSLLLGSKEEEVADTIAGTHHVHRATPCTTSASRHHRIGRFDAQDLGYPNGSASRRAQGPHGRGERRGGRPCSAGPRAAGRGEGTGGCECRRRGRVAHLAGVVAVDRRCMCHALLYPIPEARESTRSLSGGRWWDADA